MRAYRTPRQPRDRERRPRRAYTPDDQRDLNRLIQQQQERASPTSPAAAGWRRRLNSL